MAIQIYPSSFPRRRESRRRIHLPAITTTHWIPAFAGMTKEKLCRKNNTGSGAQAGSAALHQSLPQAG
jgi:hypothetical protein